MATWADFLRSEPDFAMLIQARFDAHRHKMLATLRKDGSPRITGVEATFANGELWLGMMPGSMKALDLRRDARLTLHSAPDQSDLPHGDARVSGLAIEYSDDETQAAFSRAFKDATGNDHPPGPFHLFSIDIKEAVLIRIGDPADHLVIEIWREGEGLTRKLRR